MTDREIEEKIKYCHNWSQESDEELEERIEGLEKTMDAIKDAHHRTKKLLLVSFLIPVCLICFFRWNR